jgi:hypothetical protein
MAAREVIHSRLEAQPILHARFSAFAPPERMAAHLRTQRVPLFLLLPTDLLSTNIHVCSGLMPMPIQMLTLFDQQETGRTFWKV